MRASARWSLLVLIAALGLLGPPAAASADDAGLRAVVVRDAAIERRLESSGQRLVKANPKTFPAYVRYLRRVVSYYVRVERNSGLQRRRYRAQKAQTADARRGRTLLLRGHRDLANASHETSVAIRRGIRQMSSARTDGAYDRAFRRMGRVLDAQGSRFRRSASRLRRGRTLIRNAPAPPATAPAPPPPAAPVPTPPAPTPPPAPAPSPPAPLLPILPGLPPLL